MKGKSFETALSAVSAALAVVFLCVGAYVPVFDLTAYMLSSVALMLPLAKKFYAGGFLSYLAACILTFFISGGNFVFLLPFAVFFGLHAFVNGMISKYNINKYAALVFKIIWFDLSLILMYHFTELFITDNEIVKKYIIDNIYIAIPLIGSAFFIFYDYFIVKAQKVVTMFVTKYKK